MNYNTANNPYSGMSLPDDEDTIDIRVPGRIRLPDMLVEAILFLLGKAGYRCKLTILPLVHYNHPYVPKTEPYKAPDPYKTSPDYTWERWTNDSTNIPQKFNEWIKESYNSTAKEPK